MQEIIHIDNIQDYFDSINQNVVNYLKENQMETFESFENFNIIVFNWYDVEKITQEPKRIVIYLDDNDLFFFYYDDDTKAIINRYYVSNSCNQLALYTFFSNVLKGSVEHLEKVEDHIAKIDSSLLQEIKKNCRNQIKSLLRETLRLKKYYEQFELIFDELCDNENNLISSNNIKHFKILSNRANRINAMVSNLKEYIGQVRGSYQAQIDIEQNDLMKFFTVTTSIFLPLSLITGWYGMNVKIPTTNWEFGYQFVIILCLAIVLAWYLIFKKKKWL